ARARFRLIPTHRGPVAPCLRAIRTVRPDALARVAASRWAAAAKSPPHGDETPAAPTPRPADAGQDTGTDRAGGRAARPAGRRAHRARDWCSYERLSTVAGVVHDCSW